MEKNSLKEDQAYDVKQKLGINFFNLKLPFEALANQLNKFTFNFDFNTCTINEKIQSVFL